MISLLLSSVLHSSEIVSNKFFGCKDMDDFDNLVSFATRGDNASFKNYLFKKMVIGECTVFRKGDSVIIKDTKIFSGRIQVLNSEGRFWTFLEAVK